MGLPVPTNTLGVFRQVFGRIEPSTSKFPQKLNTKSDMHVDNSEVSKHTCISCHASFSDFSLGTIYIILHTWTKAGMDRCRCRIPALLLAWLCIAMRELWRLITSAQTTNQKVKRITLLSGIRCWYDPLIIHQSTLFYINAGRYYIIMNRRGHSKSCY